MDGLIVGQWYNAATSHLVNGADTFMFLYEMRNPHVSQDRAMMWIPMCLAHARNRKTAPPRSVGKPLYPGPYYISVRTLWYPAGASPSLCPGYDMTGRTLRYYLPLVVKVPTPTTHTRRRHQTVHFSDTDGTATPTATLTPTVTNTPSPTPRRQRPAHRRRLPGQTFTTDSNFDAAAGCHRRAGLQLSQRCGHQPDDPSGLRLRPR